MSVALVAVEIRKTVVIKCGYILFHITKQKTTVDHLTVTTVFVRFLLLLRKLMISTFVPNIMY